MKKYYHVGKVYKDKKGGCCKMCKPHKVGWMPKHKEKYRALDKSAQSEIKNQ